MGMIFKVKSHVTMIVGQRWQTLYFYDEVYGYEEWTRTSMECYFKRGFSLTKLKTTDRQAGEMRLVDWLANRMVFMMNESAVSLTGCEEEGRGLTFWHPLLPYAIKHPVPDSHFVVFDIRSGHSDAQPWASECPDVKNYKWRLNPVRHRMLYDIPIWQPLASNG